MKSVVSESKVSNKTTITRNEYMANLLLVNTILAENLQRSPG